jgi:hypothetical protein
MGGFCAKAERHDIAMPEIRRRVVLIVGGIGVRGPNLATKR